MAQTTEEAEGRVYQRMLQFKEALEEEGIHGDEIVRGVVGFVANTVFEATPSSVVITAFIGDQGEPTDHKVYTGLHTPPVV